MFITKPNKAKLYIVIGPVRATTVMNLTGQRKLSRRNRIKLTASEVEKTEVVNLSHYLPLLVRSEAKRCLFPCSRLVMCELFKDGIPELSNSSLMCHRSRLDIQQAKYLVELPVAWGTWKVLQLMREDAPYFQRKSRKVWWLLWLVVPKLHMLSKVKAVNTI